MFPRYSRVNFKLISPFKQSLDVLKPHLINVSLRGMGQVIKEIERSGSLSEELARLKKQLKALLKSEKIEPAQFVAVQESFHSLFKTSPECSEKVERLYKVAQQFDALIDLTASVFEQIRAASKYDAGDYPGSPILDPSYLIKDLVLLPDLPYFLEKAPADCCQSVLERLRSVWNQPETRGSLYNAPKVQIDSKYFPDSITVDSMFALRGKFVVHDKFMCFSIKPDTLKEKDAEEKDDVHALHSQLAEYRYVCQFPGEYMCIYEQGESGLALKTVYFSPDSSRYAENAIDRKGFDCFGAKTYFKGAPTDSERALVTLVTSKIADFFGILIDAVQFVSKIPSLKKPAEIDQFFTAS